MQPIITVKIALHDTRTVAIAGKVADAELHFHDGPLAGLKLIGFAIWKRPASPYVTFPARGPRRSFALLRPATDATDATVTDTVRDLILDAYRQAVANAEWAAC